MKRMIRMVILLIAATVFSTRIPVNLVVVTIAALAMEKFELSDLLAILFGSLCLDQFNMFPPGFSFFPLLVMVGLIYVVKARIYVHDFMSRLFWLSCAVGPFYIASGMLLMVRTGSSQYLWSGILWGSIHAVVEGSLAAVLSPWLHRVLTISLADLRQNRSIVVPYDSPFHFRNLPLPPREREGGPKARRGEGAICN